MRQFVPFRSPTLKVRIRARVDKLTIDMRFQSKIKTGTGGLRILGTPSELGQMECSTFTLLHSWACEKLNDEGEPGQPENTCKKNSWSDRQLSYLCIRIRNKFL